MKENTVESLVSNLKDAMDQYIALRNEEPVPGVTNLLEGLHEAIREWDQEGRIYREGNNIRMNAQGFWKRIIIEKIEVIGICGDQDLMRAVYNELGRWGENGRFAYSEVFATLASGICNWSN